MKIIYYFSYEDYHPSFRPIAETGFKRDQHQHYYPSDPASPRGFFGPPEENAIDSKFWKIPPVETKPSCDEEKT